MKVSTYQIFAGLLICFAPVPVALSKEVVDCLPEKKTEYTILGFGHVGPRLECRREKLTIRINEPKVVVVGMIPKDAILERFAKYFGEFAYCFESATRKGTPSEKPKFGHIQNSFVLNKDGHVEGLKTIESTVSSKSVEDCAEYVISK